MLSANKPSSLIGGVVSDDRTPLPFPASQLRVVPVPTDPDSLFPSFMGVGETPVARDGTFRYTNISGQYLFRLAGLPPEWSLDRVMLNDRNHIDTPLEFQRGGIETKGMELVIGRNAASVSGEVVSRDGQPAPDSTVIVFPPEPGRWVVGSRFIRAVRPDSAGRFTIAGLPAGSYRAAAREFVPEGQWEASPYVWSRSNDVLSHYSLRPAAGRRGDRDHRARGINPRQ